MKKNILEGNRANKLFVQLCDEIDRLEMEAEYYKELYEREVEENIKSSNERLAEAKKGIGMALMFALSCSDAPDGGLVIDKESRKQIAKQLK